MKIIKCTQCCYDMAFCDRPVERHGKIIGCAYGLATLKKNDSEIVISIQNNKYRAVPKGCMNAKDSPAGFGNTIEESIAVLEISKKAQR